MKKLFLEDLPKWNEGERGKTGSINWSKSIGYKIRFIYDDISGELEIVDYNKPTEYLILKYDEKTYKIRTDVLVKCKINSILKDYNLNNGYKYNIGDIIENNKTNIKILEKIIIQKGKYKSRGYKYLCLKCNQINEILEKNIDNNIGGCPVCVNKVVIKGINDIATTHPYLVKYFNNIEDAYKHSFGSGEKVPIICPNCRVEKEMKISKLSARGFSCSVCSDNISYPEKFLFSILEQFGLNFYTQLNKSIFKWCNKYKYDFAFELNGEQYICETHGVQHYEDSWQKLEKTQLNDKLKKELALTNGIKPGNYIVIDCRYSELEYIKQNILKSELSELFNLNSINWLKAEEFACNSRVKEVCDLWNSGKTIAQIIIITKLCESTVRKYLKNGNEIGFCKHELFMNVTLPKKIICLSTLQIFNSISEAMRFLGVTTKNGLINCCKGRQKTAYNCKWMYYDDYIKLKKQEVAV